MKNPYTKKEIDEMDNPFWKQYYTDFGDPEICGEWSKGQRGKFYKQYYFISKDGTPNIENWDDIEEKTEEQISLFQYSKKN